MSGKKKELIKRVEVKGTPFVAVTDEEGTFLVLGRFKMTEKFKSKKEAIEKGSELTWNNITNVLGVLIETIGKGSITELKEN